MGLSRILTRFLVISYKFESFKNTAILEIILHDCLWNRNKDTAQMY